jgi:hypothetical protein
MSGKKRLATLSEKVVAGMVIALGVLILFVAILLVLAANDALVAHSWGLAALYIAAVSLIWGGLTVIAIRAVEW